MRRSAAIVAGATCGPLITISGRSATTSSAVSEVAWKRRASTSGIELARGSCE